MTTESEVTGFVDGREVWLTRTSNGYTKTYIPQDAVAAALLKIEDAVINGRQVVQSSERDLIEDIQCALDEQRRELGLEGEA